MRNLISSKRPPIYGVREKAFAPVKIIDNAAGIPIVRSSATTADPRPRGGVAEWLKAADCKSADVRLRRFESYPLHHGAASRWAEGNMRV